MEEKKILNSIATKFFGLTDEEFAELLYQKSDDDQVTLKEDAADLLIEMDAQRVERLKENGKVDTQKYFDNGYKKGQSESLTRLEKEFLEKTGYKSELKGVDLFMSFAEDQKGKDVDIKTHPDFLKREKDIQTQYEEEIGRVKDEFEDYKKQVEDNKRFSMIASKAEKTFLGMNPVLSEDPVKAKRQTEDFLNKLRRYKYEFRDDRILILENGNRKEDSHGNPVKFEDLVRSEAGLYFDFKKQEDRRNAGNDNDDEGGSGKYAFTTEKEYNDLMRKAAADRDDKAMVEINQHWKTINA